jgi:signal peptide peptidase SppA
MKDYVRIVTKIRETPWLITPESLQVILEIVDARIKGQSISDEEIEARLSAAPNHPEDDITPQVENGVGVIPIFGPIFGKANLLTMLSGATSTEQIQADLASYMADDAVTSVLLHIDSPGGTSEGIIETAEAIKAATEAKPVYALADSQAGSAAYWLMSQATKSYATLSGSVGSIGVYTVHDDQSEADRQAGHRFSFISAGKYKTEGNPHEPLSVEGQQYRQEVVNELYDDFIDAVADGRSTTPEQVLTDFGEGRMLSSKKALDVGMIDGIMSYDALTSQLVTQAQDRPVSLYVHDDFLNKTVAEMLDSPVAVFQRGAAVFLEHKEEEHAEPGTGSPPAPRRDQSGEDDRAIQSGSRRDPLPLPIDDPSAPKPNSNKGGETVLTPEQIAELYKLFGLTVPAELTAETDHSELLDKIKQAQGGMTAHQRKFAEEFPEEFAEMTAQADKNRVSEASAFVNGLGNFKRQVGEDMQETNFGLSALALESLKELHIKAAKHELGVADLEEFVSNLMSGAVEFGERGTSKPKGAEEVTFDLSTAQGVRQTRQLFFDKVQEIQLEDDGHTFEEAMKIAAQKYPELAQAYATTPVS